LQQPNKPATESRVKLLTGLAVFMDGVSWEVAEVEIASIGHFLDESFFGSILNHFIMMWYRNSY
jgi:hypothetical protein